MFGNSFCFLFSKTCFWHGSQFRTIPAATIGIYHTSKQTSIYNPPVSYQKKYQPYRPISSNTGRYRAYWPVQKKVFFFFFLSFLIFEFLLEQNDNLFVLTYQYYLFSQYAMVTFKLSILFFFYFFSHLIDTKV